MKIVLLSTGRSENAEERVSLLTDACRSLGVEYLAIETLSANRMALPNLAAGDALYNSTRGGLRIEEMLWRPGVATFYAGGRPLGFQDTTRWLAAHTAAGLRQPRTLVNPTPDRALLTQYVEFLRGFPLVVKVEGGTLGTGVIRTDSWPALLSLVDHLYAEGKDFLLREYIKSEGSVRLMVVGGRVVASFVYENPPGDFRSNTADSLPPKLVQMGAPIEALAVDATMAAGVEMAGVDVMLDVQGKGYLLEMNLPCGFATFHAFGVNVAELLIQHLIVKAERLQRESTGT